MAERNETTAKTGIKERNLEPKEQGAEGNTCHCGITDLLEKEFQVDFKKYKASTLNRRTQRRMLLGGFTDIEEYHRHLTSDPEELKELFQNLLINVTQFFRDAEAFEALKETVYPTMIDNLKGSEETRVWVAGCSTGEEAYSIAITLVEYLDEKQLNIPVKIIGTDVNPESINKAVSGHYPESIEGNLSEERLKRFFTRQQGGYRVSKRILEMCTFSQHDILIDPTFGNMDLISCRNLLIYLNPETQGNIISAFHRVLKPSGFLFLGKSETVGPRTLFKVENSKLKIYSKKKCLER